MDDFGKFEMVAFRNFRERVFFMACRGVFFALRFSRYDSNHAAMWCVVIWRVLRWVGSDQEMEQDKFLSGVGNNFTID